MKAAVYSENGSPNVFSYEEVEDPTIQVDEVLIKVDAISIEGGDLSNRQYVPPQKPKHIVGYAASGEVIQVGDDVSNFKVGDKVVTFNFSGSHAEMRAAPAATTFHIPAGMESTLAIAAFIGVGTAAMALHLANIQSGDNVLITGGAGGVGNALIQLANLRGATTFTTSRSEETLSLLKDYGASYTINTSGESIDKQVKEIIPAGVDVFIDTVGMDILLEGMNAVKDGGKVLLIAGRSGKSNYIDPVYLLGRRLTVIGCYIAPILHENFIRELIDSHLQLVAEGKIKVPISKIFKLSEVVAAHERAEQPGKLGRVIMLTNSG